MRSIGQAAHCQPKAGCARHRGEPWNPPRRTPRGNRQKLFRALQKKSRASPCSTPEKNSGDGARVPDTIPETWGSRACNETARSKQIFLIKKSKSSSLALQFLGGPACLGREREPETFGLHRDKPPHASPGFMGGGDWVSGGSSGDFRQLPLADWTDWSPHCFLNLPHLPSHLPRAEDWLGLSRNRVCATVAPNQTAV